ncbi:BPI fold-containing family A member 2 [Pteropus vampyrus]|uniref:BPI fold-containing family A member 2 n=1 Tax=Pteropus vampyrus TaxID=132908 RepID=A0A6P3RMX8_PTEVA|nr:BPI fold-containing family A member 2 [Pteropus vampyrus]
MFQLWKLVLLCGLLTGTSASLLESLDNHLGSAVNSLKSILDKGLDTVDNTLEAVLGKEKDDVATFQDSKVWQSTKQKFQDAENLVNNGFPSIFPVKDKDLGLRISDTHILDVRTELAPDGRNLNLRFPITANVIQSLPLLGQTVNLKASLDLLTSVRIETSPQTGLPLVVQRECISDPASIHLTLLGRRSELVSKLANIVSSVTRKTVSFLVQKQMCPLVQAITSALNVDFIQNAIEAAWQNDVRKKMGQI